MRGSPAGTDAGGIGQDGDNAVARVVSGDRPAEPGELACDRDGDDCAALAAFDVEPPPHMVQSLLGFPGDRDHGLFLAVLAALERCAEPGWAAVMPCRFDQQPARVPGAGLGDVPLASGLAG